VHATIAFMFFLDGFTGTLRDAHLVSVNQQAGEKSTHHVLHHPWL